ncbi:MAG: HAD family hydrolase [Draconibacterium sp.]
MKADLANIRNIIFDLGNVILTLDFEASIRAFQKLGLSRNVISRQQAYADPVFYQLETGAISPERFRERVREIVNNPLATDKEIDDAWYAMIGEVPEERVKVLKQLNKKYRVYLFSNTNEIHISRMHADFETKYGFAFSSLFEEDFYSHELCERKPDVSSFKKVIELAGINPEETLFVDDLEKNTLAAAEAGLKVFWLRDGIEITELF